MLKIGINTNNECGQNDEEIFQNLKNVGFENVMLYYNPKGVEQSMILAKSMGLNIVYYHISNNHSNDLWAVGESVDKFMQGVIDQIELCGKHKIPIAVMHCAQGSPSDFPLKPNKQGLNNFKKILDVAKKCNVKIALENIDCFSIKNLHYLLDNINDDNLGFCYDAGHHHLYNAKKNLLKKYANRVFATHLHDNLMDWHFGYDYTRDLHRLPFDGKIDFEKVCQRLKKANYNGIVMLEVHKKAVGSPQLYENVDNLDFLAEAKKRAEKLVDMIEKA